MIIKKRQLFIDSPYVLSQTKVTQDPTELLKRAEQELLDAHQEAEQIINEARMKAQEIIENAKKESQNILEKAKKESLMAQNQNKHSKKIFEKEKKQSIMAHNQIKTTIQTVNKIIEEFQKQLKSKVIDISNQLVGVLHILIRKITYREIDKVDYERKIESILTKIIGMKNIKVTMSVDDFKNLPQLVEQFKAIGAEVTKSNTLKSGDVIVDTQIGIIDGTKQYAYEIVEQLLEEVFGRE
ncbi:MAG: FliH/SctL family protein [Pseudothermotoga sp.]